MARDRGEAVSFDWERIVAITSAIAGIVTLITLTGFSIDPPWVAKADVESIEKKIEENTKAIRELGERLKEQGDALLILQREYWRGEKAEAEKELLKDPDSRAIRKRIESAQDIIDAIDRELAERPR